MKTVLALVPVVGAVGPITKVVDLLQGLKKECEDEASEHAIRIKAQTEWCRTTVQDLGYQIETGERDVEEFSADAEAGTSEGFEQKAIVDDETAKQAYLSSEQAKAKKLFEEAHGEKAAEIAEMEETVTTLQTALRVLQRAGLNSSPGVAAIKIKEVIKKISTGLTSVMNAAFLDTGDKEKLKSLMQDSEEEDDDLSLPSGTPSASTYNSHSTGILDTLADLRGKAEKELVDLQKTQMKAKQEWEMKNQELGFQLKASLAQHRPWRHERRFGVRRLCQDLPCRGREHFG